MEFHKIGLLEMKIEIVIGFINWWPRKTLPIKEERDSEEVSIWRSIIRLWERRPPDHEETNLTGFNLQDRNKFLFSFFLTFPEEKKKESYTLTIQIIKEKEFRNLDCQEMEPWISGKL